MMPTEELQHSHRSILKASSLIGGSAFIEILIRMIRVKFVAVLLGPMGVGLIGIYSSIVQMVSTVAGMGLGTSGVGRVAKSYAEGDDEKVARTVIALRRTVWITGISGLLVMVSGCALLSRASFGNHEHALPIALLGLVVLVAGIETGQRCILQGARRITDLAKITVVGAVNGTLVGIPCFYLWGQQGIVPSLILSALATLITTWCFAKRVRIKPLVSPWHESKTEALQLLHFGLPVMLSTLLTVLTAFVIRAMLTRQVGLNGVGMYQAAYGLAGVLVNFVLNAMQTDYYPRLTAAAHDNDQIGHEVNAQTEIGLLLAVPGLAAMMIFAPVAIAVLYSGEFDAALNILRWMVLGIFCRVICWPLGFVMLAKRRGKTFFFTEFSNNGFHLLMIWLCVGRIGLVGAGIAFAAAYSFYTILVLGVAYILTNQTWTTRNLLSILLFASLLSGLGLNCAFTSALWLQWAVSVVVLACLGFYCLHRLSVITGVTRAFLRDKFLPNERE